jgi:hypothetical protein
MRSIERDKKKFAAFVRQLKSARKIDLALQDAASQETCDDMTFDDLEIDWLKYMK